MLRTDAAIGKDVIVGHYRCESARDGHARAHGGGEVAAIEHYHLAADHVGGDGAKWDRQPIKICLRTRAGDVAAQQVLDTAGIDNASGQQDALVPQAQLDVVAVGHPGAILLDRLQVAPANPANHRLPVDAHHELLESCCRNARRVAATHKRAHAGSRKAVDRDVHLLEHLEHADVRATLGAATRKDHANAGS